MKKGLKIIGAVTILASISVVVINMNRIKTLQNPHISQINSPLYEHRASLNINALPAISAAHILSIIGGIGKIADILKYAVGGELPFFPPNVTDPNEELFENILKEFNKINNALDTCKQKI